MGLDVGVGLGVELVVALDAYTSQGVLYAYIITQECQQDKSCFSFWSKVEIRESLDSMWYNTGDSRRYIVFSQ